MRQREADIEATLTAAQKKKLDEIRTTNKEKAEAKKKELEAKKTGGETEKKDDKPASE